MDDCRWCGDTRCDETEKGVCILDCGLNNSVASNKIELISGFSVSVQSINEDANTYIVNSTTNVKFIGLVPTKAKILTNFNKYNGTIEKFNKPWWLIFTSKT